MPQIEKTRTVRVALFGLRIYLVVLLTLIALSFFRQFRSHVAPEASDRPRAEAAAER